MISMCWRACLRRGRRGGDPSAKHFLPSRALPRSRAVRPDLARLGELDDYFVSGSHGLGRRARRGPGGPDGSGAGHVGAGRADRSRAGAPMGHDPHVHDDVGGIRDLDAEATVRRADGTWSTGPRTECGPASRRGREVVWVHALGWITPVVRRAGIGGLPGADEGAVFHAGDVARVGACQEAVRAPVRGEAGERARLHQLVAEPSVLLLGAVAPVHPCRRRQRRDLVHPAEEVRHALRAPHPPVIDDVPGSRLHGAH